MLDAPPEVLDGSVCANCKAEFDGKHGRPVLCFRCYIEKENRTLRKPDLPKGWLELK